jgi:hypothetical protein
MIAWPPPSPASAAGGCRRLETCRRPEQRIMREVGAMPGPGRSRSA